MTFKPKIWFPISTALSVLNLAAVPFAAAPAEPVHATIHAVLAVAFGLWAQRLYRQRTPLPAGLTSGEWREELESEVDGLHQQLAEAQERLDFAERMLTQRADPQWAPRAEGTGPPEQGA